MKGIERCINIDNKENVSRKKSEVKGLLDQE